MNVPLAVALGLLAAPRDGRATEPEPVPEVEMSALVLLPPSLGLLLSEEGLAVTVSAPVYFQFGEVLQRSGQDVLRSLQLGIEPSVLLRPYRREDAARSWDVAWQPSVAVGFRRRWAGESVRFAVGAWHRVELQGWAASFEPELVMFLGPCCRLGSVEIAARVRVAGPATPPAVSLRVGFSYW